jgi:hypothetical protein
MTLDYSFIKVEVLERLKNQIRPKTFYQNQIKINPIQFSSFEDEACVVTGGQARLPPHASVTHASCRRRIKRIK